jgi:rhodanese-related sulfurtransferase
VAKIAKETRAEALQPNPVEFQARVVKNGDEVRVGAYVLEVLATPGHTEESISLKTGAILFSGDALMIGGAGRTDFQNGSPETLWESFESKLRKLPVETVVYPAHDYKGRTHTTIGDELQANGLFRSTDRAAFIERLKNNKQPEPANMRSNLAANRSGGLAPKTSVDARELQARIASGERIALVDVRSEAEFAAARIKGAQNFPLEKIGAAAQSIAPRQPVVLLCATGLRSMMAIGAFAGRGNVASLVGGMAAWRGAGLPLDGAGGGVWPLERQVRLIAGAFVLISAILGLTVSPWFFGITLFFGAGLTFSGLSGWCGMALLLGKLPWNKRAMSAPAAGAAQAPEAGGGCGVSGGGCGVS